MTREEFDNQSLPKSDANANLETLSRNKLRAMFSLESFEVRDELQHDKGVDLSVEIKSNSNNTNLRFPIQLKATRCLDKNNDGSISFSIGVANINYLLNDGLPAFYILYHLDEDIFYFERAQEVENQIKEKYPAGNFPQSFTFRFSKVLDQAVIEIIRTEMLSRGYLRRSINKAVNLSDEGTELRDSIVVRKDQGVYSPSESLGFLENYGFRLLNDGQFSQILDIEKRCYPLEQTSAIFHFVCGTAAHYKGLDYDALKHYKQAEKLDGLHREAQNMMRYYRMQSKLNLGIINAEQSLGYVEALMDSDYLGLYLKLQKSFETYYVSHEDEPVKRMKFQQAVDAVLASPNCSPSISLIAESYVLSAKGHYLNDQLLDYLLKVRDSMENPFSNPKDYQLRSEEVEQYNERFKALKSKALKDKNQFTYHNICLNGIKILYIKTFYTDIIMGMNKHTLKVSSSLTEDDKILLTEQAAYAGHIASLCEQIGVAQNMIASLSQQYEILHFIGDFEAAEAVLKNMEQRILDNEWHGLESKVSYLKNGGTSHAQFTKMIISSLSKSEERRRQLDALREEIDDLDAEDWENDISILGKMAHLNIFPLGNFVFLKDNLDNILDAIDVTPVAKKAVLNVMEIGAMPILNAFRNPVVIEGPDGGFTADKGPDSLVRIHTIRKKLRELGAYRA